MNIFEKPKIKSEAESDRIIHNLIWNNGYGTVYYLGMIHQLAGIAKVMRESTRLSKNDILILISSYKENKDVPNEIKELVDIILDEFDFKEN